MSSSSSTDVVGSNRSAQDQSRSNVYCQHSGLENVIFSDIIKDDSIPEGDGQVARGSVCCLLGDRRAEARKRARKRGVMLW